MRKLRVERLDLMQVHNLVDVQTHLATLRTGRRPGASATSASPTTTRALTPSWSSSCARGDIDFVQVNYSLAEPEADAAAARRRRRGAASR